MLQSLTDAPKSSGEIVTQAKRFHVDLSVSFSHNYVSEISLIAAYFVPFLLFRTLQQIFHMICSLYQNL